MYASSNQNLRKGDSCLLIGQYKKPADFIPWRCTADQQPQLPPPAPRHHVVTAAPRGGGPPETEMACCEDEIHLVGLQVFAVGGWWGRGGSCAKNSQREKRIGKNVIHN